MVLNPYLLCIDNIFMDKYNRYQRVLGIDMLYGVVKFQLINKAGSIFSHLHSDKKWWESSTLIHDTSDLDIDPWLLSSNDTVHDVISGQYRTVYSASSGGIIFTDDMGIVVRLQDPMWEFCRLGWEDITIELDSIKAYDEKTNKTPDELYKEAAIDFFFFPDKWRERVKKSESDSKKNKPGNMWPLN